MSDDLQAPSWFTGGWKHAQREQEVPSRFCNEKRALRLAKLIERGKHPRDIVTSVEGGLNNDMTEILTIVAAILTIFKTSLEIARMIAAEIHREPTVKELVTELKEKLDHNILLLVPSGQEYIQRLATAVLASIKETKTDGKNPGNPA